MASEQTTPSKQPKRGRSMSPWTSCRSPTTRTGRTARPTSSSSGCAASARSTGAPGSREYPEEDGLLVGHDGRRRPRRQPRLEDLLVGARDHRADPRGPAARAPAGDVHRHGPAQARPPQGALPARLHARSGSPTTRTRSAAITRRRARPARAAARRCDLVSDVAQPVVSRVIGSFMGIPPEDDAIWARLMNSMLGADDPDLNPGGDAGDHGAGRPRDLRALRQADRRAPREPDRRSDERPRPRRDRRRAARGARDRHGVLPARRGRQRQHEGDLLQRDAGAARGPDAEAAAARRPGADPGRGRGVAADVPGLRALPAHRDRGHRAERADDPRGREGGHVVRRRRTATRRATRTPTASTSPATPSTRRSAPAAATSASAPRWRGSSCGS